MLPEGRALSRWCAPGQAGVWMQQRSGANGAPEMIRPAAMLLLLIAAPAAAAPGGTIGTLPHGDYACEQPGDAAGAVGRRAAEADFAVTSASSYQAGLQTGTYLYTGDRVLMTSGPRQGQAFRRVGTGTLRAADADGALLPLRCVRVVVNNRRG